MEYYEGIPTSMLRQLSAGVGRKEDIVVPGNHAAKEESNAHQDAPLLSKNALKRIKKAEKLAKIGNEKHAQSQPSGGFM